MLPPARLLQSLRTRLGTRVFSKAATWARPSSGLSGTAERADACILRRLAQCENRAVRGQHSVRGRPALAHNTRNGGATRRAFCFLLIQFILKVAIWPNL